MSPRHRAGTPHGLTTTRSRSKHHPIAALGVAVVLAMAPSAAFAEDFTGDRNDNTITGTPEADTIDGLGGDDKLNGEAGDDLIQGGNGDDELNGGAGEDTLLGQAGDDVLNGGEDGDTLVGGPGDDTLNGDAGDDVLDGGAGDDDLRGGAGDDTLNGQDGNDLLCGGPGQTENRLTGGDGDDLACTVDDSFEGTRGDAGSFDLSANDEGLSDEDQETLPIVYRLLSAIPGSFLDGAFDGASGVFSYSAACETGSFDFQYSATRGETGPTSMAAFNLIINAAAGPVCDDPVVPPAEPVDPTDPTDPPVDNGDDVDPVVNEVDDNDVAGNGVGTQPVVAGASTDANLPNAGAGDELGALVPAGLAAMVVGGVLVAAGRHRKSLV